ncbi:MAG: hypothetical protein RIC55_27365 [Pirellulaceae bacterium]
MLRASSIVCTALLLAVSFTAARADTLRLVNGDTISGKVVSVDDKNVTLQSDTLGRITLPRDKVAAMVFGDAPAASPDKQVDSAAPGDVKIDKNDKPEDIIRKLIPKGFNREAIEAMAAGAKRAVNPDDVIRQLREAGGVDPAIRRELSLKIPGFTAPAVQGYFDKQVNGLMSGDISLGDIRNDAVDVRDQLEKLKKDLGPSGEALNGYLDILNGFIQETDSIPAKKPAKKDPADPAGAK